MQTKLRLFLLSVLLIPCWVIAARYNVDLVNLYAAAGFTHTDLSRVYAYNGTLGRYFYGPFSLILISPLAHLSFEAVKWFWILLQTISYVVFWMALSRLYPVLKEKRFFLFWIIIWIVSINPIHNNFQSNNIQLMLAALLLVAELKSREDVKSQQIIAGGLVAIATMIKVFPLFIAAFYLLVKPKWVRAGLVFGFIATGVLPLLFFGFSDGVMLYREFFSNLTTYTVENSLTKVPDILCLPSMVTRILSPANTVPTPAVESIAKGAALLVSAVFFLWVSLKLLKKQLQDARYSLHVWALACALMVFVNPSSRPHYFIFYVPAFCSVLEILYLEQRGRVPSTLIFISTLLVAFTTDLFTGKSLNDTLEFQNVPTWGLLCACVALLVTLKSYSKQLKAKN